MPFVDSIQKFLAVSLVRVVNTRCLMRENSWKWPPLLDWVLFFHFPSSLSSLLTEKEYPFFTHTQLYSHLFSFSSHSFSLWASGTHLNKISFLKRILHMKLLHFLITFYSFLSHNFLFGGLDSRLSVLWTRPHYIYTKNDDCTYICLSGRYTIKKNDDDNMMQAKNFLPHFYSSLGLLFSFPKKDPFHLTWLLEKAPPLHVFNIPT